jgi:hypothetical protein
MNSPSPARPLIGWIMALSLAAQAVVPGLAGAQSVPQAGDRAAPPPRDRCVRLANIDWRRLERQTPANEADDAARLQPYLARAMIPAEATLRPSAEADIVIRAYIPTHRYYQTESRAVVWREPDGEWWFWRQQLDWGAPELPPIPPNALAPGETWRPPPPRTTDERFPPASGRLSAVQASALETAWSDRCRVWEPGAAGSPLPLRRPEPGDSRRERWCPHGATPIMGEITERGRPARLHFYPCDMDFSSRILLSVAASATGPSDAETRVMERLEAAAP